MYLYAVDGGKYSRRYHLTTPAKIMTQTSRHLLPTNDDVVYVVDKVEGSKIGRGCGIKERPKESAPGQLSPAATEASRPRWTEATWDVVTITGSAHLLLLKCCRTPNKSRACTSIITNVQANNTCLTSIYFMFNPFIFLRIFKRVIPDEGVKQGVLS